VQSLYSEQHARASFHCSFLKRIIKYDGGSGGGGGGGGGENGCNRKNETGIE
jgi:hypothetical protein